MKKMKKILFTLAIGIIIASCNNQGNDTQLNMDLNSEKLIKTKSNKKGFKFDKKNNYISSNKNKSKSKSAETHPGCSSECCSKK
jgi:hypothetical protein